MQRLCPSARAGGQWARDPADIDLATTSRHIRDVDTLLLASGFTADVRFNLHDGSARRRYLDVDGSHVDVFINDLQLCHVISWRRILEPSMPTLPIPELLLTKLQIVSLEIKDRSDIAALLTDQWTELDARWADLERAVHDDWGLWRTGRSSIEVMTQSFDDVTRDRATDLLARWQQVRFSPKAKVRARIGDRVRWYQEPEEV